MAFVRALLMHQGHSPEAIDAMPWRDVELYLACYPIIQQLVRQHQHG